MRARLLTVTVASAFSAACASAAPSPAASPGLTYAPPPPVRPAAVAQQAAPPAARPAALKPTLPPPALQTALEAASQAIAAGRLAEADQHIAAAAIAAGEDAHLRYLVARTRATRAAYAADFEAAAAAYLAVIPELAKHAELPDEFWSHNAMMMIREAQGDPAAALAENDQASLCAARGTWDPQGRATLAFQKDRWHRAYLTRMLAESRTASIRQALIQYAQTALDEYRVGGFPESIAVLEAYFAALDGRPEAALAAARSIDPAKDDDVEDLYLVVVGLEAGGDHAAADSVRQAMRRSEGVHVARPIMLRWLDLDAKTTKAHGFTPWHAKAAGK